MENTNLYLVSNGEIKDSVLGVIERGGEVTLRLSDLRNLGLTLKSVPDFKPGTFIELDND